MCKCYGFFRYQDWGYDFDLPQWAEADIKIIYREKIKVFYNRVQNAQADGYTEFKSLNFSNKNGYLYSFTGLRGDAKRLYHNIHSGREKRVKLVKAPTVAEQAKFVNEADLVIWACGYQTKDIPIKDQD